MVELWTVYLLLLLLPAQTFLESFVGGSIAWLAVIIPLPVIAYWRFGVPLLLSSPFRQGVSALLRVVASHPGHAVIFGAYLLSFTLSLVRAVQVGTLETTTALQHALLWASIVGLLVAIVVSGAPPGASAPLLRAATMAFLVYAGVNASLYLLDVKNEVLNAQYLRVPEPATMPGLVGLDIVRAALPLSGGINTAGLQVASGAALGLATIRAGLPGWGWGQAVLLSACSLLGILVTDSRGGMLGALAGAAAAVAPAVLRRRAPWLAIAVPILPLVLMFIASLLSSQEIGRSLERGDAQSFGALTGRPLIWGTIALFLSAFQAEHLVGYGALGQIGSGVGARYAFLFASGWANPSSAGAHNAFLQAVLDVGYVGAALQLFLYWHLLAWFARESSGDGPRAKWATAGLAATVCLLFLGTTGETLSITTPNTLFLFLALNLHVLTTRHPRGGNEALASHSADAMSGASARIAQ